MKLLTKYLLIIGLYIISLFLISFLFEVLSNWNNNVINIGRRAAGKLIVVGHNGIFMGVDFVMYIGGIFLFLLPIILAAKYYIKSYPKISYIKSLIIPFVFWLIIVVMGFLPVLLKNIGLFKCSGEDCLILLLPIFSFFSGTLVVILSAIVNAIIRYNLKKRLTMEQV